MNFANSGYLRKIKERAKKSRVHKKHQLVGLQIAEELSDPKHKALYMKLAKGGNQAKLQWLAADVADRRGVKNKGAYFMATLMKTEREAKEWLKRKSTDKVTRDKGQETRRTTGL